MEKAAQRLALGLAAFALAHLTSFPCAAEQSQGRREFSLALRAIDSRIPAGTAPAFLLTLTNISDHTCRVLNIARRADLQHAYFDLVVTKSGKPVHLSRAISDPGPVSDADWVQVLRGATKTFTLKDFPQSYDRLHPGTYEAYVRFWPDPFQSHATKYRSGMAKFTVIK